MIFKFLIFLSLLVIAALVQVSFLQAPLGLIAILIWIFKNGLKGVVVASLIFSISLALFSNIPVYLVVIATSLSCALVIFSRNLLPERKLTSLLLFTAAIFAWEGFLYLARGLL